MEECRPPRSLTHESELETEKAALAGAAFREASNPSPVRLNIGERLNTRVKAASKAVKALDAGFVPSPKARPNQGREHGHAHRAADRPVSRSS